MTETPELETGYGPSSPRGDNLLNDFVQDNAASFAAFGAARGDRIGRVENVVTLIDAGSPLPFSNRAVLERPIDDIRTVLDHIRPFYDTGPTVPFLLDSAWPTPDLEPIGFTRMGHPPLMVRPPGDAAPARTARAAHRARRRRPVRVRLRTHPDRRLSRAAAAADDRGHDHDAEGARRRRAGITSSATSTASPSPRARAYVGDRLVRVDNIATLESARGRGYGLALTAAAAAVDPSKPATLIASDLGRPVYDRLGFVAVMRFTYWLGLRSADDGRRSDAEARPRARSRPRWGHLRARPRPLPCVPTCTA